ncbi:hypothetical protein OK016_23360 [Vibrio chagasii]|nr:hypothetical protein [Vibrio chagasii]
MTPATAAGRREAERAPSSGLPTDELRSARKRQSVRYTCSNGLRGTEVKIASQRTKTCDTFCTDTIPRYRRVG